MKWADFLISAVKYDANHKIVQARQHRDTGEKIEEGELVDRKTIETNLKHRKNYATIFSSNANWKLGEKIRIIRVNGENSIRTDSNKVEYDNLKFVTEIE